MDATAIVQVGGPWAALLGTLIFGIRALIKGDLLSRSYVDALKDGWEARLSESHQREQDWRSAYLTEAETSASKDTQLRELMSLARTMDAFIKALPKPGGGGNPRG